MFLFSKLIAKPSRIHELLSCFQPFPGAMHNGHTKPMDRDRTDQRSHDDIDSRNDETFGDAALGMWMLTA